MIILGIDPGLQGGLVIIQNGNIIDKMPAPVIKGKKNEYDINAIIEFIKKNKPTHAGLEKAQAMPGQGVCSMFSTGKGFGMYWGIIAAMGMAYILPPPREWQKNVLAGYNMENTKQASALFCSRTWPKEDWKATERCRKVHDGLTDAGAIAWHTWQFFK